MASMKPSKESKIAAYFPVVQWVWSGVLIVCIATGTLLYNLKVEALELRHKIEMQKQVDGAQDGKIDALTNSLERMGNAQEATTKAINDLGIGLEKQNHRLLMIAEATKKANELLSAKLDSHIALSKATKGL